MAYKVLDIYKDLPLTNCGDCGKGGCFAFASAVYLEGEPLENCPHLSPERQAAMTAKLEAGRAQGEGRRPESTEQAFEFLKGRLAETSFPERAEACGARYEEGPPESLLLPFLGSSHRITRDDVMALEGPAPTIWVKVFLAIYATRSTGSPPRGEWAAYRELPNTVSKSRSFEQCAERLATEFQGREEALVEACERLGGRPGAFGSADRVWVLPALPRVELLLLYWRAQEEFEARVALLVDRGILEYLDQEAIVFLAEATVQRLLGKDLGEVVA